MGVIILEQCNFRVEQPTNQIPYGFSIGKTVIRITGLCAGNATKHVPTF